MENKVYKNITAIILAGGKSSRMKQDKGLVMLNGKMMVEYILDKAKMFTDKIIIITNSDEYNQFGFPCYADMIKDSGPMGGIYTGLANSTTQKNLVLSCDAPFVSEKVLTELIKQTNDEDVLVAAHDEKIEPLCAVYDLKCKDFFKQWIENVELKMMDALQKLNTVKVNFTENELKNSFANINTPEDLAKHQNKS
ncbi:MAG: molybdenum cofactor guanylyltransferase [Bacteroidia bacterium]